MWVRSFGLVSDSESIVGESRGRHHCKLPPSLTLDITNAHMIGHLSLLLSSLSTTRLGFIIKHQLHGCQNDQNFFISGVQYKNVKNMSQLQILGLVGFFKKSRNTIHVKIQILPPKRGELGPRFQLFFAYIVYLMTSCNKKHFHIKIHESKASSLVHGHWF